MNPAPPDPTPQNRGKPIKPVPVPIPPDRPSLSTAEFLKLLAVQGVSISERSLQRHAEAGAFADRYPGWVAQRGARGKWLISPAP